MKTIINKFSCLIAVVLVFACCTSIEHDTDTLKSVTGARGNLTQAEAYYLGDANGIGTDVFNLCLMTEGVSVDYKLSSDEIVENTYRGNGYVIFLELSAEAGGTAFPVGTFNFDKDEAQEALTFENAYCIVLHDGSTASAATKLDIVDGTFTITASGDSYTVKVDVTNVQGTKIEASYSGKIEVADPIYIREPLAVSALEFKMEALNFTTSDFYKDGSWNVDLNRDGTSDISLAKLTLTGDAGMIVIDEISGSPYKVGEEPKKPEAGTYALTAWTYEPLSFTPGEIYDEELTGSYACLLTDAETPAFSALWYFYDATMVVTETADSYKITIEATSANGSTIKATYEE